MNRANSVRATFLAALALLGCVQKTNPVHRSDDEEVIEAAMLAFYLKSEWNTADWEKGDFVVLRSKSLTSPRVEFNSTIEGSIASLESEAAQLSKQDPAIAKKTKAQAQQLRTILEQVLTGSPPYDASAHPTINAEHWDPRIVVADPKGFWSFELYRASIKNRLGTNGTMRVIVELKLPGYSHDGQFAVVTATAPWSIHFATLIFVLHRTSGVWKVEYADAAYQV